MLSVLASNKSNFGPQDGREWQAVKPTRIYAAYRFVAHIAAEVIVASLEAQRVRVPWLPKQRRRSRSGSSSGERLALAGRALLREGSRCPIHSSRCKAETPSADLSHPRYRSSSLCCCQYCSSDCSRSPSRRSASRLDHIARCGCVRPPSYPLPYSSFPVGCSILTQG